MPRFLNKDQRPDLLKMLVYKEVCYNDTLEMAFDNEDDDDKENLYMPL